MIKTIIIGAGETGLSIASKIAKTSSCTELVLIGNSYGGFIGDTPCLSTIERKLTVEVDKYNLHKNTCFTKDTYSSKNHNRPNKHKSKRPYHS